MKILMVLSSHDARESSGGKTALEEFAAPYYVFKDAGAFITVVSPKGGKPPFDPQSGAEASRPEATLRLETDPKARAALARTLPLAVADASDFDAVFYQGGQGCLWDLADDPASIALIVAIFSVGKPAAFVGRSAGALRHVRTRDGAPMVQGRNVTGPPSSEETADGLPGLPFLVEDMLTSNGARYTKTADGKPHVVIDGILITGQNSASSAAAARALLKRLGYAPREASGWTPREMPPASTKSLAA